MKAQRKQSVMFVIVSVLVLAFLAIALALPGMKKGADTIGNGVANSIDNTVRDQEAENAIWQFENSAVTMFWVSQQKLMPNKHAVERHGADAWAATNCYNNNGFFQMWQVNGNEFHGLCDDDGTIRDIILKQRAPGSKEFDFINAFTPQRGILREVVYWLRGKGAMQARQILDAIIYIDGVAP